MFRMFSQLFSMLTTLFGAGEKLANAGDHLATWAEEQADGFNQVARLERAQKLQHLQRQLDDQSQPFAVTDDAKEPRKVQSAA